MKFDERQKVLIWFLFLNWLVAFSQIFLGIFTGALSVLANGLHSLFDGATNIVGILGIRMAKKPADESHPYGHRKYETIAVWVILLFMVLTVWEVGQGAVERIMKPRQPEIEWFMLGILVACVIIDYFVARYEYRKGVELKSEFLTSDALHTKTHYITSGAVILGVLLIKIGAPLIVDPIITIFVVGVLCWLVYEVFKGTFAILSDKVAVDARQIEIIASSVQGVESCHKIRSRGTEDHILLDIHLVFRENISLGAAHRISFLVKEKIQKEIPEIKDVTIHQEPKGVKENAACD